MNFAHIRDLCAKKQEVYVKKLNGFNMLGFIGLTLVLGSLLLAPRHLFRTTDQKVHQVRRLLEGENFVLTGDSRIRFAQYVVTTAEEYEFDPLLILAIMKIESSFNPRAVSYVGALGLMQVMPVAAREVASSFETPYFREVQLFDPYYNVRIGVQYLSWLRDMIGDHSTRMLSAYNMGPTLVKRRGIRSTDYSRKVLRAYERYQREST